MAAQLYDYDPADSLNSDDAGELFLKDAFATADPRYFVMAMGVAVRAVRGRGNVLSPQAPIRGRNENSRAL